jgi:small subunit ribosomal protein S4
MARYIDAVCRQCRREGQKLFLKGDRCYSSKCSVVRRTYAPGQHGQGRKKTSEYGIQLREKQKAKRYYGVLEKQFLKYYEMAAKAKGQTGENMLRFLETRLDNVVYRIGLAMSHPEARQLVNHGHFTVNGRKVSIPSFLVRQGDVIALREKSRSSEKFKVLAETSAARVAPAWLDYNSDAVSAKVLQLPTREQMDLPIEETLIVEFYSK